MKGQNKHFMLKVLMVAAVLILAHLNLSGIIWYNDSDIGFEDGEGETISQDKPLKAYVIEGAGYFLISYSDFLRFLNKVEMAELEGVDWNELQFILNGAIEGLQYANNLYVQLKQKADVTPYNPIVISELLNFNYDAFLEKEGIIKSIFKEVKAFLSKGKIREMYGEAISHTQGILNIANVIKAKLDEGIFPETSNLHDLNEAYSHYMLFGEYAAKVFQKIN